LLADFEGVLFAANRFFGASAPDGRFLFCAPGAVKKDDIVAVCGQLCSLSALLSAFLAAFFTLPGLASKFLSGSRKKVGLHRWSNTPIQFDPHIAWVRAEDAVPPQPFSLSRAGLKRLVEPNVSLVLAGCVRAFRLKLQVRVASWPAV
jgi:hypothetical protein